MSKVVGPGPNGQPAAWPTQGTVGASSGALAGRVAIVTGGARGIGRATVLALAAQGAAVVVNYREQAGAAEDVVATIRSRQGKAVAVQADVAEARAAGKVVETALERWGRVDILVNNAGVALYRLLIDTLPDEWDRVMAVHLRGAFNCCRAVLPHMIGAGQGRIINVTSVWGQVGAANEVAYSTAKAGLIGFTRSLAKEVGRAGITVNAVAPGVIETDMLNGLSAQDRRELAEANAVGRLGCPEDVAHVIAYLASSAGAFVTGQIIGADGGMV